MREREREVERERESAGGVAKERERKRERTRAFEQKERNETHQESAGQMPTEPSGLTVFPGGTRHDLPSALKVVPVGHTHVP